MRAKTILIIGFVVLLISIPTASTITWQVQMPDSINLIRAEKSLAPLKICRPLVNAAQNYAKKWLYRIFWITREKMAQHQVVEFRKLVTIG